MRIPSIITAGDTPAWVDVAFADGLGNSIDSGSYTLTYSFRGPIVAGNIDVAGTAKGNGWAVALTTAQTAAMNNTAAAVTYFWQAVAAKAGARVTAGTGTLQLKPNLAGLAANAVFDGTTQAEKDLQAVRAEMSARISGGMTLEYTIGNRSLKKESMAALMEMEQRCLRIVRREKLASAAANGLGNPGRLGVRFV